MRACETNSSSLLFLTKIKSSLHNIPFSIWKSCLAHQALFKNENSSKQICQWILMWEGDREWTFLLKEELLLIMVILITGTVFCFLQTHSFSLINGDVLITNGLLWCFYQLLGLSYWRHPFTAVDPLVSKWCNILNFTIQLCFLEAKSMKIFTISLTCFYTLFVNCTNTKTVLLHQRVYNTVSLVSAICRHTQPDSASSFGFFSSFSSFSDH